jgi:hypothetical protein
VRRHEGISVGRMIWCWSLLGGMFPPGSLDVRVPQTRPTFVTCRFAADRGPA